MHPCSLHTPPRELKNTPVLEVGATACADGLHACTHRSMRTAHAHANTTRHLTLTPSPSPSPSPYMSAAAYPPTPQRSLGPPQEPLVEGGEAKLDGMTMGMTPIHASRER